ncbi:hypothetical protein NDU88_002443 [Pleurodeles waltl]|uniref:Uncharacterized protein n=1 Tax=Pleurodeles waltl TaxID=8319 RepID=A0AAV7MXE7_PLEWA|nr:hypothetical protein NDU88_002443 [Pleurodeles waltl]
MPRGYFHYLLLRPGSIFLSPRNDEWPDGGGIFKSLDFLPGGRQPDPRSKTTRKGPTAMVMETSTPGPSHGGDEQEAAGR